MQFVGKALKQEYKEKLQGYISQHDLHNAEFVGQVEHERIPEYLEKAHVFPSASKMEVQSLVVIEALASGTPVVGLSNETIDELVNTQVGCWLEKETPPEEFADRIRDICQLEQGEYEEMCRQAQKRVKHLDWSEIVEQTTAAYQEIREAKPSRSEEKSDLLTGLVTFFSSGEVESFLTSRILEAREKNQRQRGLWKQINIPAKLRALRRVQGSTWLISGATIVISVLGYLFMKGRSKDS
jgi:hypothetical protein